MKAGDLLFQVDPRPYQAGARPGGGQGPSGGVAAEPGQGTGQRESGAGRAGAGEGRPGRGRGREGGGRPAADGARRRPLHAAGPARIGEPARARQRGPEQPREPRAVAAARAAVQNAQASVSQARAALEKARADVETQEANIAAARAALANAKLNLGYTRVLVADLRRRRASAWRTSVTTSARTTARPLTTVSQVDPIYAEFPISEQLALAVFRRWDADPRASRDIELELILADGSAYPCTRTSGRTRPAGRRDDRHRAGARRVPESGQRAAPRPVRQGAGRRRGEEERAARPAARRAGCPGRRTRSPSSAPTTRWTLRAGEGRRARRHAAGSSPRGSSPASA